MKTNSTRFKVTVVIYDKKKADKKVPLCIRSVFCYLNKFSITHDLLLEFAKKFKADDDNIGYAINSYLCEENKIV